MYIRPDGNCNYTIVIDKELKKRIISLSKDSDINIQSDVRRGIEYIVTHYENLLKGEKDEHKK